MSLVIKVKTRIITPTETELAAKTYDEGNDNDFHANDGGICGNGGGGGSASVML